MKTRYFMICMTVVGMLLPPQTAFGQKKRINSTNAAAAAVQAHQEAVRDSLYKILTKAKAGDADSQNEVGTWYYNGQHGYKQNYEEALQWWAKSGKQNNAQGIGNMAICYQTGHGIAKDSIMAVKLYDKAIEKGNKQVLPAHEKEAGKGNVFSAVYAAHCYKDGVGTQKDLKKAATYLTIAGKAGVTESIRDLALIYLNGNNSTEAVKWFQAGAAKGDLSCTYWYGKLMLDGNGIAQNKEAGFQYIKKAADKGFAAGEYQVGNCYNEGNGVKANAEEAYAYYKRAAAHGNVNAKWELGTCYKDGKGTATNYDQAMYWYSQTIKLGYTRKFQSMCSATEEGNWTESPFMAYLKAIKAINNAEFTNAQEQIKVLKKAKKVEATTLSALIELNSANQKANAKKGVKLLQSVSEQDVVAAYTLATCYQEGTGVEKNAANALATLESAAKRGYAPAQCDMGDKYFEANGVSKDYPTAVKYYKMALEQGQLSNKAAQHLATCYENAWGVERNLEMAKKLKEMKNNDYISDLLKLF